MSSQYLSPQDAIVFGLTCTSNQIIQASTLLNAYLSRPEGLVYSTDFTGAPIYMAGLSPLATFTLMGSIAPGYNVTAYLSAGARNLNVGDVLILDRMTDGLTEAVVISTVTLGTLVTNTVTADSTFITADSKLYTADNALVEMLPTVQVTFQLVLNSHISGANADYGLVIEEQREMPSGRPLTNLMRTPVANILSGVGRYAYGRRGESDNYNLNDLNLLAALSNFGGPPVWELWQAFYSNSWNPRTGQVWVPAGILLSYYSQVKIRYVAGFPASAIPDTIKMACAQIIEALQNNSGSVTQRTLTAGGSSVTNFAATLMSDDVLQAINQFRIRGYV